MTGANLKGLMKIPDDNWLMRQKELRKAREKDKE